MITYEQIYQELNKNLVSKKVTLKKNASEAKIIENTLMDKYARKDLSDTKQINELKDRYFDFQNDIAIIKEDIRHIIEAMKNIAELNGGSLKEEFDYFELIK